MLGVYREDGPGRLLEVLETVPDPRSAHGLRHPLGAVLALSVCAMLCGARSLYAIAQWGREHPELADTLGFTRKETPCVATLHQLFRRLDVDAFEAALSEWAQGELGDSDEAIAIDGKGLRGIHDELLPGVHLVAAYAQGAGLVLAQKGGEAPKQGDGAYSSPSLAGPACSGR